jgi:hypothetical protein
VVNLDPYFHGVVLEELVQNLRDTLNKAVLLMDALGNHNDDTILKCGECIRKMIQHYEKILSRLDDRIKTAEAPAFDTNAGHDGLEATQAIFGNITSSWPLQTYDLSAVEIDWASAADVFTIPDGTWINMP